MIISIRQTRLWRSFVAEIRVFVPVLLHQWAIVQIFEPTATITHCRFEDFRTNCQKHIAGRHASKLAFGVEIRRRCRQRMVNRGWSVNANAARLQLGCEVVQKLVCTVDGFLRTTAPLAAHVAVFRHLRVERWFLWRDMAIVCPSHDNMFKWIPFVPAVHYSVGHTVFPDRNSQNLSLKTAFFSNSHAISRHCLSEFCSRQRFQV